MFQQPDKITIVYAWDNEVRRVRMNQPHPARVTPSWYGDSVGYYEGDTLVIDTVGIKADRPFAMVGYIWHAIYECVACGRTISIAGLRSREKKG